MKRENKKRKRLLLLAISLIITFAFLTTTTFAWFTANQTVTISPIQVNVEAQGGIQLSADGTNWRSVVSATDIMAVHATTYTSSINQIPTVLEAVSSATIMDASGLMEMYYGTVSTGTVAPNEGLYILSAAKDTEVEGTTGRFVAFDLFFRSDTTVPLYLTVNSGVTTPDVIDTGIRNAARVAFVILGNTPIGSAIGTIQGLNSGVASPVYLWEPNYDRHTAPGIANAFDTYGLTITDLFATPVPYSGVKAEFDTTDNMLVSDSDATTYPTLFDDMTPDYTTIDGFSANEAIFTVNSGITKIRLYMWVEGQDVDCENSASGANAIFNVQISTEA